MRGLSSQHPRMLSYSFVSYPSRFGTCECLALKCDVALNLCCMMLVLQVPKYSGAIVWLNLYDYLNTTISQHKLALCS